MSSPSFAYLLKQSIDRQVTDSLLSFMNAIRTKYDIPIDELKGLWEGRAEEKKEVLRAPNLANPSRVSPEEKNDDSALLSPPDEKKDEKKDEEKEVEEKVRKSSFKTCSYVFSRGPRKGTVCSVSIKGDGDLCSQHEKTKKGGGKGGKGGKSVPLQAKSNVKVEKKSDVKVEKKSEVKVEKKSPPKFSMAKMKGKVDMYWDKYNNVAFRKVSKGNNKGKNYVVIAACNDGITLTPLSDSVRELCRPYFTIDEIKDDVEKKVEVEKSSSLSSPLELEEEPEMKEEDEISTIEEALRKVQLSSKNSSKNSSTIGVRTKNLACKALGLDSDDEDDDELDGDDDFDEYDDDEDEEEDLDDEL